MDLLNAIRLEKSTTLRGNMHAKCTVTRNYYRQYCVTELPKLNDTTSNGIEQRRYLEQQKTGKTGSRLQKK